MTTVKDLRNEMIMFYQGEKEDNQFCSYGCRLIKMGWKRCPNILEFYYTCELKGEENKPLARELSEGKVIRCQQCKDLFK